jgi:hypothetical protein
MNPLMLLLLLMLLSGALGIMFTVSQTGTDKDGNATTNAYRAQGLIMVGILMVLVYRTKELP